MTDDIRYPIGQFIPVSNPSVEERNEFVKQIPEITRSLQAILQPLEPEQLHIPYRPGGWTIQQIVHHMADNDMNAFLRFKRSLTENEPFAASYREDLFAELNDYTNTPIATSLILLEALHDRFVILLEGMNDQDFQRTLRTQALGVITLDTALQRFLWHNRHHISQIKNLIDRYIIIKD